MPRIFISYRREDSDIWVARIADALHAAFDRDRVFLDLASIAPGADFVEALNTALADAAATLVVIGPSWLNITDKAGRRRLDQPGDFVRMEVVESLRRSNVRVIPILVNGAQMPAEEELPEPMRPLTRRQALELTVRHWSNDIAQLTALLRQITALADGKADQPKTAVASPDPVSPRPPDALVAPPRSGVARRTAWIAGIASTAIAAAIIGAFALRERGSPPTPPDQAQTSDANHSPTTLRGLNGVGTDTGYVDGSEGMATTVEKLSRGRVRMDLVPAAATPPIYQILDEVAQGKHDFAWISPAFYGGKDAAFYLLDGPPFGPGPAEYLRWRNSESVRAISDDLYRSHGAKALTCGVVPVVDLWSKRAIRSGADLRGLKVRAMGLRAEILAQAGAVPVALPAGEIYQALSGNRIDAIQIFAPASGLKLGLSNVTRFAYYPGRLTATASLDLIFNSSRWEALPNADRQIIERACDQIARSLSEATRAEQEAVVAAIAAKGVTVAPLGEDVTQTLRKAWRTVAEDGHDSAAFQKLVRLLGDGDGQ